MLKKFTAILFCSIACVIQFAHSAIPHTHEEAHHHHGGNSHHHHHDHETDGKKNPFAHLFSHFGHSAEVFTNTIDNVKTTQKAEIQPAEIAVFVEKKFIVTDIPQEAVDEPDIYISPHLLSLKFRGPPAA